MKRFFLFLCVIGFMSARAQDVVVTDVKITFYVPARSEDKAVATQITATLYTVMGKRVAMLEKCCGNIHYPDANYSSSTYQLDMRNTIRKEDIQSGYFDVHIDVEGADKWVFIPTLKIFFSDGTSVVIKGVDSNSLYTRRYVSNDVPDTSFPFHL